MSSTYNMGNQTLTFDYKQTGTSQGFNKLFYKLLDFGIVSGGDISIGELGLTVSISPFLSFINDDNVGCSVRLQTSENVVLNPSNATPYIIGRFTWVNTEDNYMDFRTVSSTDIQENDIIFGKCVYKNGSLIAIDYTKKTWARIHYEQPQDEPNFKVYADESMSDTILVGKGIAWINGKYVEFTEVNESPEFDISAIENSRIDLLVIDENGNLIIVKGEDEENAVPPSIPFGTLLIATVTFNSTSSGISGDMIEYVYNNHVQLSYINSNFLKNTYIVNSNASLEYWLTNGTSGTSSGGSNFTSVLIKKGTWSFNGTAIALDTIGTKTIEGETDSKIEFSGTDAKLYYNTVHKDSGYWIKNIIVEISDNHIAMENCSNIENCKISYKGDNIWIACGGSNGLYWSEDGKTWTQSNITSGSFYGGARYANGIWIVCGNGLYWSEDGKTWTQSNIISGYFNGGSRYANDIWVACDNGLYWSEDGKTWTQSNITSGDFNGGSRYANDIWVACGNGLYWSEDGKTWTQSNITSGNFGGARYANDIWVAGNNYNNGLYWSEDGKNWTQSSITSGAFIGARYANGIWVACDNGIYWSTDGKTWTQSNMTSGSFRGARYANGLWVAHGSSNGLYWSTDGKTWTQSNITSGNFNGDTRYANDIWVACSGDGLYWSIDGKTWTQSNITSGDFYGGARTQYSQLINCYNVHNCITTNNTMNTFASLNNKNSITEDYHGGTNIFLTSN